MTESQGEKPSQELKDKVEDKVEEKPKVVNLCALCKKESIQRCGVCRTTYYCSKECQLKDWTTHKPLCQIMKDPTASPQNNSPTKPTEARPSPNEGRTNPFVAPNHPFMPRFSPEDDEDEDDDDNDDEIPHFRHPSSRPFGDAGVNPQSQFGPGSIPFAFSRENFPFHLLAQMGMLNNMGMGMGMGMGGMPGMRFQPQESEEDQLQKVLALSLKEEQDRIEKEKEKEKEAKQKETKIAEEQDEIKKFYEQMSIRQSAEVQKPAPKVIEDDYAEDLLENNDFDDDDEEDFIDDDEDAEDAEDDE